MKKKQKTKRQRSFLSKKKKNYYTSRTKEKKVLSDISANAQFTTHETIIPINAPVTKPIINLDEMPDRSDLIIFLLRNVVEIVCICVYIPHHNHIYIYTRIYL